ncbi:MAG: sensor domain-containing protein [Anaerolineales bacterium]|jgi:hypothetical protein
MINTNQPLGRFFKVVVEGQTYLNLFYLGAAFPLGLFYFVFLVSGIALGISLSIIWVGIPILLLVGGTCWALAAFERTLVVQLLKEDIPPIVVPINLDRELWADFKRYYTTPTAWKGLLYLLLKFPLGLATFVVLATLIPLTIAFLSMPFTYDNVQFFQVGLSFWIVDSLGEALFGALIGLILVPVTLNITNALAWIHARFARVMLGAEPFGKISSVASA